MSRLFLNIIAGILALWIADRFVQGVEFRGPLFIFPANFAELERFFGTLVFVGAFLGFLNFFLKPILNLITLPLRLITFGLFGFIINLFLIWIVDVIFPELIIVGPLPLIYTTLILWILTLFVFVLFPIIKRPLLK